MNIELKVSRLLLLVAILFSLLLLNLFRMQILKGDYYQSLSEKNRVRVVYLEGPRGKILDRRGRELANNRLSFNCTVTPGEKRERIEKSFRIVASILQEDPDVLDERYQKRKPGAFNSIILAEDISASQAIAIEERLDLLPGFMIETRPQREYPYGEAAAHLTGFLGPFHGDESEDPEYQDYNALEWLGKEGLEKFYEGYLHGRSGGLQMEVNSRGRFIKALGVKEPMEGKDIQLTIDADLQEFAQALFKSQKGAAIVMELEKGGILALNSAPSFDPNLFSSTRGRKNVGKYLHDPDAPMLDRGIQGQYPPGSIFKIVTALAALGNGRIQASTVFNCQGSLVVGGNRFHCWNEKGHGPQGLTEAFAHSCDVYFYRTGLAAGVDALYKKAVQFGFASKTGIDLPGEREGFVPSREWKENKMHAAWYDGDEANFSIGQGYLQVTPIQALQMITAIATGGKILEPHLVDKINGVIVGECHSKPVAISPEDLKSVKEGLDQVVNSGTGTGRLARVPGVRIAGKTGSAQAGREKKTHAWFVGYAPEKDPKVAMVIFLEHGGHGGVEAAEIAHALFRHLKESGYLNVKEVVG